VHLVFDGSFLPRGNAIMVPHTSDGRVMFAIPWHGHTVVGTTDTPLETAALEPRARPEEIAFILETAARYLERPPTRADVKSVFAGVRPLVRTGDAKSTASLSRDHTIHIDSSGLLTLTGGKWTTYRNMAEDTVNQAATLARLPDRDCPTRTLNVHAFHPGAQKFGALQFYGADALLIEDLVRAEPALGEPLHPALPTIGAEIVFSARHEMSRTVEDALARRTRGLFLNAQAAAEMAPRTAELLARELGRDSAWRTAQVQAFRELAAGYRLGAASH
jgi:glycerol-3-phosphate dehydrogenase